MENIKVDIRTQSNQIRQIFKDKDLVTIEELIEKIEELDDTVDYLEDKIRDMEQDIEDNYKRIPYSEQVGISERDFI